MEYLEDCVGWMAAGVTLISYFSPIIPYINLIKGKISFEDTPAVFVSTAYVNYFCWYIYGNMIFSDQLKVCYLIGTIINLILMVVYLAFEVRGYLIDSILNALILISGTWSLYRALTVIIDDDRIVGKVCVGTSWIVFLSPIQVIYKVTKEKIYSLIQIYNCWLVFFSSILWVIYGILIKDIYVGIPNAMSIILALIEIFIYINFKKKYPFIGDRDFTSTIGIETSSDDTSKKEDNPIKSDQGEIQGKEKPVKIATNN